MIPSYQFSPNPAINPNVNPFVSMPPGMYQAGVYYTQPAYSNIVAEVMYPRVGDTDGLLGGPGQTLSFTNTSIGMSGDSSYAIADAPQRASGHPGGMTLIGSGPFGHAVVGPVPPLAGVVDGHRWILAALGAAVLTVGFVYGQKYFKKHSR